MPPRMYTMLAFKARVVAMREMYKLGTRAVASAEVLRRSMVVLDWPLNTFRTLDSVESWHTFVGELHSRTQRKLVFSLGL